MEQVDNLSLTVMLTKDAMGCLTSTVFQLTVVCIGYIASTAAICQMFEFMASLVLNQYALVQINL